VKSTYKLLGVFWDRMETKTPQVMHLSNKSVQSVDNTISFSKLLTVQDESEYEKVISEMNKKQGINVFIDLEINSGNPIIGAFLSKRLGQMVSHLLISFPAVCCFEIKNPSCATNA